MDLNTDVTMTLERGLEVLRAFRAERIPLTNSDLVKRTGLSRSVVSRFTSTLIQLGFLRRVANSSRFELAAGVFGIGNTFLETNPVTRMAEPLLEQLANEFDVAVALAVPLRLDMLYVAHCHSARTSTLQLGVGSLLPMGTTAIGKAWLWTLPDAARRDRIAQLLGTAGGQMQALESGLLAAFDELSATGVCTSIGQYQKDVYGIAVPIRLGCFETPTALSFGAVDPEPDVYAIKHRLAPAIKLAATNLSKLLQNVPFKV